MDNCCIRIKCTDGQSYHKSLHIFAHSAVCSLHSKNCLQQDAVKVNALTLLTVKNENTRLL